MMTKEQAEKNITSMAENIITPEFLDQLWIMAGFLLGWGIADTLHEVTIITFLLIGCGIVLAGCVWYVRKNFEWNNQKQNIIIDPFIPVDELRES